MTSKPRGRRDLLRILSRSIPAIIEFNLGEARPYRILYSIDDDTNRVVILRIDHRLDVYRSD